MMNIVTLKIGSVLRGLLHEQRLTLKELSAISGVPASTIAEWTNNRTPKNPVQVQKVANALGVTLHFLFFGQDDREEPLTKLLKEEVFSGTFEITIKRVRKKNE